MGSAASSGRKSVSSWIRMCPLVMKNIMQDIGMTLYHELYHVNSAVYDHPNSSKAYGKKGMLQAAQEDPVMARLNSGNYCMYMATTGMSREDFNKYTTSSGANAKSPTCYDSYGNCSSLVGGKCCGNRKVGYS